MALPSVDAELSQSDFRTRALFALALERGGHERNPLQWHPNAQVARAELRPARANLNDVLWSEIRALEARYNIIGGDAEPRLMPLDYYLRRKQLARVAKIVETRNRLPESWKLVATMTGPEVENLIIKIGWMLAATALRSVPKENRVAWLRAAGSQNMSTIAEIAKAAGESDAAFSEQCRGIYDQYCSTAHGGDLLALLGHCVLVSGFQTLSDEHRGYFRKSENSTLSDKFTKWSKLQITGKSGAETTARLLHMALALDRNH
ncbi:MAG: hypothetical protein HY286_10125 [Planctomycetes bacterium]|nr:hypothetical protein [Planctomycetota bacterium]